MGSFRTIRGAHARGVACGMRVISSRTSNIQVVEHVLRTCVSPGCPISLMVQAFSAESGESMWGAMAYGLRT